MKAPCPYYRKCSGCTRLADPYVRQLFLKNRAVAERFARFALAQGIIQPIVASPSPFAYRSSVKHCLHEDAKGQRAIGLYKFGTKLVVDIPNCPVQEPGVNRLLKRLFSDERRLPAPFYNHSKRSFQEGRLKFVTIRHCAATGEAGVIISHTGIRHDALAEWANSLRLNGVSLFSSEIRREDKDLVLSERTTRLAGRESFLFRVAGMDFELPPLAFFQANSALADEFVHTIADPNETGRQLIDLYGGFGAYSFAHAGRFTQLIVVDGNKAAIHAAQRNAERLAVKNIQSIHASVEEFLAKRLTSDSRQNTTHLIVNPPRAGLSNHVKETLSAGLWPQGKLLTYVSCDIASLTRDLDVLTKKQGWRISSVRPFDMFPQTEHIELVVKLSPTPR